MAEKRPQLTKGRNFLYSSSASARFHSSSSHFTMPKASSDSLKHAFIRKATDHVDAAIDDNNQNIPSLVGTCPFMCPEEERARRERLRDLAVFERLYSNPAKSSPDLAVKKFCRTISSRDTKSSDVRPVSVLMDTLSYLLNLMNSNEHPFEVVHDFIFDRTRCIRQDLSMQNAMGDEVIHMYERMIRFHIISHHYLHRSCGSPDVASTRHLNMEQLMKALTSLLNLYKANRRLHSVFNNEAEFHSIYVLFHLAPNKQDGDSLSLWFRHIPFWIVRSIEMCFARKLLRCFRLSNYKRFIHIVEEEASSLQYCCVEPYVNEMRILALSCVSNGGYKFQPYPLAHLSKLLIMKESDVESLCVQCGLEISADGMEKGLLCVKQHSVISMPMPTRSFEKYYPVNSKRIERCCAELSSL